MRNVVLLWQPAILYKIIIVSELFIKEIENNKLGFKLLLHTFCSA